MPRWPLAETVPGGSRPNHGSRARIDAGGYAPSLIDATETYVRDLLVRRGEPLAQPEDLRAFVATELASGAIEYFAPYERVHRANLGAVAGRQGPQMSE